MTDDELDDLTDAKTAFWREFSELCNKYLDAAPPHLKAEYKMSLGELTSIYGIKQK